MMWLNQSHAMVRRQNTGCKRPTAWRPTVEMLEDRRLLSSCPVFLGTDTPTDPVEGELRYCMNQVPAPDTIDITFSGPIQLKGALPVIDHGVTITGLGTEALTIERAEGGDYRIFTNVSWVPVKIQGMTIRNGSVSDGSGGGGIRNDGDLTIENSVIKDNKGDRGGGIHNTGKLTILNSTLSNNTAIEGRYDYYQPECPYEEGCVASLGGAIFNAEGDITGLVVSGSTIHANNVRGDAANSQLAGKLTYFAGGGIYNVAIAQIYDTEITSNGVCVSVGDCTWDDPLYIGIDEDGKPVPLDPGVWFFGAGVYSAGVLDIRSSTISRNKVGPVDVSTLPYNHKVAGGGIFSETLVNPRLVIGTSDSFINCTISENSVEIVGEFLDTDKNIASAVAGGLHGGSLRGTINNTTLSNNVASNTVGDDIPGKRLIAGGGTWFKYVTLEIGWSTIVFNTARSSKFENLANLGGGGVYVDQTSTNPPSEVTLVSTIVAKNRLDGPGALKRHGYDINGLISLGGSSYNFIGAYEGSNMDDADSTNQVGYANKPLDPMLAPLALNDCDYQVVKHCPWTHMPHLGSQVINKGGRDRIEPLPHDARGQTRQVNDYDIGSLECQIGECTKPMPKPAGGLDDVLRDPVPFGPPLPAPSAPPSRPDVIVHQRIAPRMEPDAVHVRKSTPSLVRLNAIKRLADMDWTAVLHDELPLFGAW